MTLLAPSASTGSVQSRRAFLAKWSAMMAVALTSACTGTSSAPQTTQPPSAPVQPPTAAAKPAATTAPAIAAALVSNAPVLATLSADERSRVAGLIGQAKTENGLNWITTVVTAAKDPLLNEFKKRYDIPNLQVTFENMETGQVTARIQGQQQARKVTTDFVALNGSPSFFVALKQAGALLEYRSPELAAYQGTEKFVSADFGYWVSAAGVTYLPVYNPKVVPNGLSSWNELLDPKYKGRFSFPGVPSSESALFYYYGLRKVMPLSYFEGLAKNDWRVGVGNSTKAATMVAEGELDIAVTNSHAAPKIAKQLGVPLAVAFPKEGTVMDGWSLAILANSPSPATAKLFMDFMLSKDAQEILVEYEAVTPARKDVKLPAELEKYVAANLDSARAIPVNALTPKAELDVARAEFETVYRK